MARYAAFVKYAWRPLPQLKASVEEVMASKGLQVVHASAHRIVRACRMCTQRLCTWDGARNRNRIGLGSELGFGLWLELGLGF